MEHICDMRVWFRDQKNRERKIEGGRREAGRRMTVTGNVETELLQRKSPFENVSLSTNTSPAFHWTDGLGAPSLSAGGIGTMVKKQEH